jgi:hypothetical protein
MIAHACNPSYTGAINRRIVVQDSQGKCRSPCLKNKLNQEVLVEWLKG